LTIGAAAFNRVARVMDIHKLDPLDYASVLHVKARHNLNDAHLISPPNKFSHADHSPVTPQPNPEHQISSPP
jgi:hypothetical protein